MGYIGRRIGRSSDTGNSTPDGTGGGILDIFASGYFQRQGNMYNIPPEPGVFPSAYESLINSFGTKYYVAKNGSDSTGNGSLNNPWLTIKYAESQALTNSAIIIYPGTYNESNYNISSGAEAMVNTTKTLSYIAAPGKVILTESGDLGLRDNNILAINVANTKLYGFIFKRDNNARVQNYSTAIWSIYSGSTNGEVYNCVFEELNANGYMSYVYDNGNAAAGKTYNSLFVSSSWLTSYSGGTSTIVQNTALTSSSTFSLPGTSTNNVNGATINATTYSLTNYSNSTYGVYSGTYAWA